MPIPYQCDGGEVVTFPTVQARALSGPVFQLPEQLPASQTVVIAAFRQWHQSIVDEWIVALVQHGIPATPRGLTDPATAVIEVPVLKRRWSPARAVIDGGMASGIADADVNARTWTAYTDVAAFLRAFGETDESTVLVAVVDRSGDVATWVRGPLTDDSLQAVLRAAN